MITRNEREELAETTKTASDGASGMGNFSCLPRSPGCAGGQVSEEHRDGDAVYD